jgi:hypothetical protein
MLSNTYQQSSDPDVWIATADSLAFSRQPDATERAMATAFLQTQAALIKASIRG